MSTDDNDDTRDAPAPAPANARRKGPPVSLKRAQEARRRFLRSVAAGVVVVGAGLAGYIPVASARSHRLRPPGALDEADFLASCIKCGQCVQVCPVQAIHLGDITEGFGIGVPIIAPRQQACDFSCDAGQCILACPTGALSYSKPAYMGTRKGARLSRLVVLKAKAKDPEPTLNVPERMGLARLARPEGCLALQGKGFQGPARGAAFTGHMRYVDVDRWKPIPVADHPYDRPLCDLCVTECPIEGAIRMEPLGGEGPARARPVVLEQCIGCGVCEMICPAEPAAIVVDARQTWGNEA
ncbi:MAG: 4Fe-4S dicluster domain-containing protein [Rhodocyclaceae bacterium]|jgi:ferredoxin-type protein NapG|nr:4Fe-4S dicluster domain-containing protein [Rhodocyclaceae bacterium]